MIELMTPLWAGVAGWLIAATSFQAFAHFVIAPVFFGDDGRPARCLRCGGADFREIVKDHDRGFVYETEAVCDQCGKFAGYWAYGSWEPFAREDFLAEYERAAPWFGLINGFFCGVAACWNL